MTGWKTSCATGQPNSLLVDGDHAGFILVAVDNWHRRHTVLLSLEAARQAAEEILKAVDRLEIDQRQLHLTL